MQTAIGYLRVSTQEQGRSGLGLAAQRHEIEVFGAREGFSVKAWHQAGHHSASFTLDQYADAVPEQLEEAGEKVASVLVAASGSKTVATDSAEKSPTDARSQIAVISVERKRARRDSNSRPPGS
jgi:hypothetical protein